MKLRNGFLGLLMVLVAGHASALTLGRLRGAAIVGQPLDVSIQIQIGAEDSASSLCMEADVFHADSRQDGSRVRVVIEPTAQAQTVNARITSATFIDEPMVTVYVRAGCGQKSSRRYVMLADFPTEPVAPTAAPTLPVVAPPTAQTPTAIPSNGSAGSTESPAATGNLAANPGPATDAAARAAGAAVSPAPPARVAPPVRPRPPKPPRPTKVAQLAPAKPVAQKPAAPTELPVVAPAPVAIPVGKGPGPAPTPTEDKPASGQSRLKLDPLATLSERVATLESSSGAPSAEVVRETQRLQTLEDSVKTLVALAAKNEANLVELRTRLQQAEAERYPVQWLYGLMALVLACLAGMAYLWSRLRSASAASAKDDWWASSRQLPTEQLSATQGNLETEAESTRGGVRQTSPETIALRSSGMGLGVPSRPSNLTGLDDGPISQVDVSLVEMTESNFDKLMQSDKSHSALRRGPLPRPEPPPATTKMQPLAQRPVNSDQLFDVRQQAEFFVSLGQTDQAIQILEKQINDHGETSPLIYLDLLQIFHSLNLKTDFRQFREDFNLLFNGRIPEFAAFGNEGRSLEEYPHVLAHITALWSTRKALMVIEASIFRDPLDDKSAPFDLAAFKDLLLLHAIAQSFASRDESGSDLAPLRADVAPNSKGARLSASSRASGAGALAAVVDSNPGALTEVDISLSGGAPLQPLPELPSATAVLHGATEPSPMIDDLPVIPGAELDLNLSDFVGLTPAAKSFDDEVSEFSKLLRAQAASRPEPPKAPAAPVRSADNNLLDFDLTSENAALALPKPKR